MWRSRWLALGLAAMIALVGGALSRAAPEPSAKRFLQEMYTERAEALITGRETAGLERFYDRTVQGGQFTYVHEAGRIHYMQSWARARNLEIVEAESLITNLRVKRSGETATVSLIARTRLVYSYGSELTKSEMGIGSWHWLQLVRKPDGWQVQREFYLDALGSEWTEPYLAEGPAAPGPVLPGRIAPSPIAPSPIAPSPIAPGPIPEDAIPVARGRLDRPGAVAYAERYCGAAWGCGNNSDYNDRYQSYRHLGGDCANFASQTLVEGGKLRSWGTGSESWVNAEAFVYYLTGSGKASLLARGTYPEVKGALSRLEPGDIVGYQTKGTITHVSVVTGRDSGGVPVVAAHTADRFRNPWDLGWDKRTVFWLLHLRN